MQSDKLIESLINQTQQIIAAVEPLKSENIQTLTWRAHEKSWSILECLEHLNLYGHYYLPVLTVKIKNSKTIREPEFKSGWLGGYFTRSMLPKGKLNRMNTFKDKNPLYAKLDKDVIDTFLMQQQTLLSLLTEAQQVSLNKVKIPISIAPFIKLKLGDTFQFYINHIIRHVNQIERVKSNLVKNSKSTT